MRDMNPSDFYLDLLRQRGLIGSGWFKSMHSPALSCSGWIPACAGMTSLTKMMDVECAVCTVIGTWNALHDLESTIVGADCVRE